MKKISIRAVALPLLLLSTNAMAGAACGLYEGGFSDGIGEVGKFVTLINQNDNGVVAAYNLTDEEGYTKRFTASSNGSFSITNVDGFGTNVTGSANGTRISGNYTGITNGTFAGTAQNSNGAFSRNGGEYSGTFRASGSSCDGFTPSGSIKLFLSAPGRAYFLSTITNAGGIPGLELGEQDGSILNLSSDGSFRGSFVATSASDFSTVTTFSGRLNTSNNTITGTVSRDVCRATFTATRSQPLPNCTANISPAPDTSSGDTGGVVDNNPSAGTEGVDDDVTGEGNADLIIRNSVTGAWRLNPLNGRSVLITNSNYGAISITTDVNFETVAIADFTGDAKSDVLLRHVQTGEWQLVVLDGRSVVTASSGSVSLPTDLNWEPVAINDFTMDERADVILRNRVTGAWFMYPMNGRNILQNSNLGAIGLTPDLTFEVVGDGDFNNDNNADLLLRNSSSGLWLMVPMNGRTVVRDSNFGGVGITQDLSWQVAAIEDFTGDRQADIFLRNANSGRWLMLPMDGRNVDRGNNFGGVRFLEIDSFWQVAGIEDYTGDGKADIVIRNNNTGAWRMHEMDGKTVQQNSNFGGMRITGDTSWQPQ